MYKYQIEIYTRLFNNFYIKVIPIGQLLYTDVGWQLPIAASNIPNIQNLPNSVSINVPAINVSPDNINLAKDRLQQYRQIGNSTAKTTQVIYGFHYKIC